MIIVIVAQPLYVSLGSWEWFGASTLGCANLSIRPLPKQKLWLLRTFPVGCLAMEKFGETMIRVRTG